MNCKFYWMTAIKQDDYYNGFYSMVEATTLKISVSLLQFKKNGKITMVTKKVL